MNSHADSRILDPDAEEDRAIIQARLYDGPCRVIFEKRDGTIREMLCTTKRDMVVEYEKKTDRTKPENNEVCFVFDLEKKEWRSFRYDSVKGFAANVPYDN